MSSIALGGLQLCLWLAISAVVTQLAITLHRYWRWPADRPNYWWGTLAIILLPPIIGLLAPAKWPVPTPLLELVDPGAGALDLGALSTQSGTAVAPDRASWWLAAPMACYLCGLLYLATQRLVQKRRLHRLLSASTALPANDLPGPRSRRLKRALCRHGIKLRQVAVPISPFALQSADPLIVLPTALLSRLNDEQCWLLLRHETAHLRQHDAHSFAALWWLCALLWFNPALWQLSRQLRLACELRCDRISLGARKNMRRAYAAAYLETLRMSAARALPCPAAAFSPHDLGHHKMRIEHILSSPTSIGKSRRVLALLLAAGTGLGIGAVHASGIAKPTAPNADAASAPTLQGPIIEGRISSSFGTQRPKLSSVPHRGVDLVAPRGTPVRSAAAGVVLAAEAPYNQAPRYGSVVVIDHGSGWQTLYAHLDSIAVNTGDAIEAGQVLGGLGSTGQATGPHVHVEVFNAGQRVDPQLAISNLISNR